MPLRLVMATSNTLAWSPCRAFAMAESPHTVLSTTTRSKCREEALLLNDPHIGALKPKVVQDILTVVRGGADKHAATLTCRTALSRSGVCDVQVLNDLTQVMVDCIASTASLTPPAVNDGTKGVTGAPSIASLVHLRWQLVPLRRVVRMPLRSRFLQPQLLCPLQTRLVVCRLLRRCRWRPPTPPRIPAAKVGMSNRRYPAPRRLVRRPREAKMLVRAFPSVSVVRPISFSSRLPSLRVRVGWSE